MQIKAFNSGEDNERRFVELDVASWTLEILDSATSWIEQSAPWIGRASLAVAFLTLLTILLACPAYHRFRPYAETPWAADALDWKVQHPLENIPDVFSASARPGEMGIVEHLRKRTYRITIPILLNLTGTNLQAANVLQQVTSVLFLLLVFLYSREIFNDPVTTFLASASIACCFVVQWSFNDLNYFDGIAFFFMILAMWTQYVSLIPVLMVLAGFTDERAIIASPLIYLAADWDTRSALPSLCSLLKPTRRKMAVLIGIVLFAVLRLALSAHLGKGSGDLSGIGLMPIRYNLPVLPLAVLLLFKGATLIFGITTLVLLRRQAYWHVALLLIACIPGIAASVLVYDLSRSLAYLFPCLFICARILAQSLGTVSLRRVTMCAGLGSVLMPTYYILLGLHYLLPAVRLL